MAEKEGEGTLRVVEAGEGRGSVAVRLRHILEASCGIHILQISCSLWVYNSAGLPIALQQSTDEEDDSLVSSSSIVIADTAFRRERMAHRWNFQQAPNSAYLISKFFEIEGYLLKNYSHACQCWSPGRREQAYLLASPPTSSEIRKKENTLICF